MASSQACCGVFSGGVNSTTKNKTSVLRTNSPTPVAQAPPVSLSQNMPAPGTGESPTLPYILKATPLVEQAPEISPLFPNAKMPIVSWRSIFTLGSYFACFFHSSHACLDFSVNKFSFLNPCETAN